jgi:uncharacterized protein with HEPN domain
MSEKTDVARLRFVLSKIEDLRGYQARFADLDALFQDHMAYDAVLMCLLQIGETLRKVASPVWRGRLPVQGAYVVRNIITHEYEGVDQAIIARILVDEIPSLGDAVRKCLAEAGEKR